MNPISSPTEILKLTTSKRRKFTESEAHAVVQEQFGKLGYARYNKYPINQDGHKCEIGYLKAVGCTEILGTGRSFRKALEQAGVFFNNK